MTFKYTPLTSGASIVPTSNAGAGKGNGFKALPDAVAAELTQKGLLTGRPSGVVVVDLDPRNFEGTLVDKIEELKLYEVDTQTVATPRGGMHFYFTAPDDILSMTSIPNAFGPGVDFKGDRGYVCAIGAEREGLGAYVEVDDFPPAPMPEHLVRVLRDRLLARTARKAAQLEAREGVRPKVPDSSPCCRALARDTVKDVLAAMDTLAGLREAQRADLSDVLGPSADEVGWDDGFWRCAAKLIEVAEWPYTKYSIDRAHDNFLAHFPDDPSVDAEHKWANGYENAGTFFEGDQHRLHVHSVTVLDKETGLPKDPAAEPTLPADGPAAPKPDLYPLLDIAALLDPQRPPRQWFLEDIVPLGDAVSIVAPGGVGKSLLALALSISACRGEELFINKRIALPTNGKIMYVDMENSEDDWAERLRDLGVNQEVARRILGTSFFPLSLPVLRGLDTAVGASQLMAILDHYGIGAGDVLILDSMQRVTEGPENDNDTIRNLYNFTSAELKRRGITVIRTDNTGWEESRVRGSSGKRDDVGYSWLLESIGDEVFQLTNSKRRSSGNKGDSIKFQRTTIDGVLQFLPTLETPTRIDDLEKMLDFKRAAVQVLKDKYDGAMAEGTSPMISQSELERLIRQTVSFTSTTGRTWIGELVTANEIVVTGGEEYTTSTGVTRPKPKFYEWSGKLDSEFLDDEEGVLS